METEAGGRDEIKWKKINECSFGVLSIHNNSSLSFAIIAQHKCSIPKLWAQLETDMYDHTTEWDRT